MCVAGEPFMFKITFIHSSSWPQLFRRPRQQSRHPSIMLLPISCFGFCTLVTCIKSSYSFFVPCGHPCCVLKVLEAHKRFSCGAMKIKPSINQTTRGPKKEFTVMARFLRPPTVVTRGPPSRPEHPDITWTDTFKDKRRPR